MIEGVRKAFVWLMVTWSVPKWYYRTLHLTLPFWIYCHLEAYLKLTRTRSKPSTTHRPSPRSMLPSGNYPISSPIRTRIRLFRHHIISVKSTWTAKACKFWTKRFSKGVKDWFRTVQWWKWPFPQVWIQLWLQLDATLPPFSHSTR